MSWIRRQADEPPPHVCPLPEQGPCPWPEPVAGTREGDLWRCGECGRLWCAGDACECNGHRPHYGLHILGLKWRRATLWQRLLNRREVPPTTAT